MALEQTKAAMQGKKRKQQPQQQQQQQQNHDDGDGNGILPSTMNHKLTQQQSTLLSFHGNGDHGDDDNGDDFVLSTMLSKKKKKRRPQLSIAVVSSQHSQDQHQHQQHQESQVVVMMTNPDDGEKHDDQTDRDVHPSTLSNKTDTHLHDNDQQPQPQSQQPQPQQLQPQRRRLGKDPTIDSSFLPDHDRQRMEQQIREQLEQEWEAKQEAIKNEPITIVYSYWNGTGHRFQVTVKKGDTIGMFLEQCRLMLLPHFKELHGVSSDNLMYVKEDLILPNHYTFYQFILTKARGKSGPLFRFDVHDDIRLHGNAQIEKDDSHAGKVLERAWYQRNKHIFPYNRYEVFDPSKTYDKYTIG